MAGTDAWRSARAERVEPSRFVVHPDIPDPNLRDYPYLAHNALLDVTSLNRQEMVLWDVWGVDAGKLTDESRQFLDDLTAVDVDDAGAIAQMCRRPECRVPARVMSFLPYRNGEMALVELREGVAR